MVLMLLFFATVAGGAILYRELAYNVTLTELEVSVTMGAECYPGDITCAGMVGSAIWWRSSLASSRLGRKVSIPEILRTESQFNGVDKNRSVKDILQFISASYKFIPVARQAVRGQLAGQYPPSVLYARCEVLPEKAWGRKALRNNAIVRYSDGHCAVVIGADGSGSYFRLPGVQ